MAQEDGVPLERRFSLSPRSAQESDSQEIARASGLAKPVGWPEIEQNHRCVILAEAGAGKTFEMTARAKQAAADGRLAFFIRIEDIEEGFDTAFEIGSADDFDLWLNGTGEAWFYLDSIDEARLSDPRQFEKAIKRFGRRIRPAQQRARVILSSRPYAWRAKSDRALVEDALPFTAPTSEETAASAAQDSGLRVYLLDPLDDNDIRRFAHHRDTPEIDRLLTELQRAGLTSLAERPFDLELVLRKWRDDRALDGRLSLLQHNIGERLKEIHPDNQRRRSLNFEKAQRGARALAAAVVLTGEAGIQRPDASPDRTGLDAETVLADWEQAEIDTLLERGLFNDPLYGMVRFRHREIRELLAAEWFRDLLGIDGARHRIETLFFREQYGHQVITPRLRPVLTWLILFDAEMRRKAMNIAPEVAIEGGDPACLPPAERRALLRGIVGRIARGEDDGSAGYNGAIARVASADLTEDVRQLIADHQANDEAISFLGRVVWQGGMTACVPALSDIATDPACDIWARIGAARGVMACGNRAQKDGLWTALNASSALLPRRLLAEILTDADADTDSVVLLLASIDRLETHNEDLITDLDSALHEFVERLPVNSEKYNLNSLYIFASGLNIYFNRAPYIERRECRTSEAFAWLLSPAFHAVERLVSVRSQAALSPDVLDILLKLPIAYDRLNYSRSEYDPQLHKLVPSWHSLNDALYWKHVDAVRQKIHHEKSERLSDHYILEFRQRYWDFDIGRFQDVVKFIARRQFIDDQMMAMSLAYLLILRAGKPKDWLRDLQHAVDGMPELMEGLDRFLNSQEEKSKQLAELENEEDLKRRENNRIHTNNLELIKKNPDAIRHSPDLAAGACSDAQYFLLRTLENAHTRKSELGAANWRALIPEYGEQVAEAYRDAATALWRQVTPALPSEGNRSRSTIRAIRFAFIGLKIEAHEVEAFPAYLTESEVRHALRYMTWELNGLPTWCELLYRNYPTLFIDAIVPELYFELKNTKPDKLLHHILHDLVYYAPWLHEPLAPAIFTWLEQYDVENGKVLEQCLRIMMSGDRDNEKFSALARSKIARGSRGYHLAIWYALWIDADATCGIPAAKAWLSSMSVENACFEAQCLITSLIRTLRSPVRRLDQSDFRAPHHLKALYILMHQHIRAEDDIERADKGIYTPELRDRAQDARNALFEQLLKIPGKATYTALVELSHEHPNLEYRPHMAARARERAVQDADLTPWSAKQVSEFGRTCTLTPTTHRQLYDVTLNVLMDLKAWLEGGNDSPYQTWKRVENETEMRNLIAGALNGRAQGRFTCAQENELANGQRTDIWMQAPQVSSAVPIELKILDNDWSGPDLCERLRNQLVGDYLREHTAGCGVFLLVWRGAATRRHWQIGGRRVALPDLADALRDYWQTIADEHPGVDAIEVMVIDLTVRGATSAT